MVIVGVVFLGLAVVYLMALVALKVHVECDNRFLVVAILALCVAIGAAFLGNDAAVRGNIPIPKAVTHPVAFSAGGGIAVFVIVLLLGHVLYVKDCYTVVSPEIEDVAAARDGSRVVGTVTYGTITLPAGHSLLVEIGPDPKFASRWTRRELSDPHARRADIEVTNAPDGADKAHVRLVIVDPARQVVREGDAHTFDIRR